MKKNNKGFTLIELLAVIIILGILMIIAIPSVTTYINNSRKSAYVDTAKEIIGATRTFVNEGKVDMFDTTATYYIPTSCISTENASKSPYGEFVEGETFVIVTYTGSGYKYYWVSRDTTGQGVKTVTPAEELDEDDIESDIRSGEITPTVPAESEKTTIKVLSSGDCKTFEAPSSGENGGGGSTPTTPTTTAVAQIKTDKADQLNRIGTTDNYIFKGADPENYVSFNGETWRIIGIYGNQIKIQRTTALTDQTYHGSIPNPGWSNSRLYQYLNQETEGGYYYSLSSSAKELIATGTWNAGAAAYDANASTAYNSATGTTVSAKVGLMASYEFLYATGGDSCLTTSGYNYSSSCGTAANNWMKPGSLSWTLSPSSDHANAALSVFSNGRVNYNSVRDTSAALPAVFLDSSVTLASGSGSGASPSDAYVFTK